MKLKTYTAESMAQALAHVRKDLGKDAMILHTRSFRVGSWFGLGGKTMVEITASSPVVSSKTKAHRAMPRVARQQTSAQLIESKPIVSQPEFQREQHPEMVIQRGSTVTRQRLSHATTVTNGVGSDSPPSSPPGLDSRGLNGRDALFADELTPTKPVRPTKSIEQIPVPSRLVDQSIASAILQSSKPMTNKSTSPARSLSVSKSKSEPKSNEDLKSQIDTLQKMMGQVLESTRKTAVAVGTNNTEAALPNGEMPAPLFALYAKMMDNDVPVEQADKLVGFVRDQLDALELKDPMIVRQALLRAIESTIHTRSESLLTLDHNSSTDRPRVIALVGPTGVGKTTTVAKLAATYKLRHGKKVGLITSDTYRIAAVEQLRTYASIIGLPLKVANSPEELAQAVVELGDCDIVVIDTAGRSQNDSRRLDELAEFTKAANPDETHLVLSTTVGDNVLRKTAERFKALGPDRCILTKLDEAVTTGPIAGLSDRIGLPLSFITVGQEVPDDLEPARVDRLARCVLDGPEAVVRRWNEDIG